LHRQRILLVGVRLRPIGPKGKRNLVQGASAGKRHQTKKMNGV